MNQAGVEFEIVPGITAAIAAAEYTGIMLTDRRYSSQVAFITGREAEGKEQTNLDWDVLAQFPGTLVFYMGIGALPSIAAKLIESRHVRRDARGPRGRRDACRRSGWSRLALGRIARECERQQIEPPALVIVGPAAAGDAGSELVHAAASVRQGDGHHARSRGQRGFRPQDHRPGRPAGRVSHAGDPSL